MSPLIMFDLLRLFHIRPIAETILSHLTLADIATLSFVSRALRDVAQSEHPSRLNVNFLLGAFVKDCDLLRQNLALHNSLLVGGAILEFLERSITQGRSN